MEAAKVQYTLYVVNVAESRPTTSNKILVGVVYVTTTGGLLLTVMDMMM